MSGTNEQMELGADIEAQGKGPNYIAYQLTDRKEGEKPFWNRIGAGFMHRDGGGVNLVLNSLPIDGKVTLRACSPSGGDT